MIAGQTRPGFGSPAYRYIRESDHLPAREPAGDPLVRVKLFNPSGSGTWWITAYDPETGIASGAAEIQEREAGDFSIHELIALRCPPFGLPVERDLSWDPTTPLSQVMGWRSDPVDDDAPGRDTKGATPPEMTPAFRHEPWCRVGDPCRTDLPAMAECMGRLAEYEAGTWVPVGPER